MLENEDEAKIINARVLNEWNEEPLRQCTHVTHVRATANVLMVKVIKLISHRPVGPCSSLNSAQVNCIAMLEWLTNSTQQHSSIQPENIPCHVWTVGHSPNEETKTRNEEWWKYCHVLSLSQYLCFNSVDRLSAQIKQWSQQQTTWIWISCRHPRNSYMLQALGDFSRGECRIRNMKSRVSQPFSFSTIWISFQDSTLSLTLTAAWTTYFQSRWLRVLILSFQEDMKKKNEEMHSGLNSWVTSLKSSRGSRERVPLPCLLHFSHVRHHLVWSIWQCLSASSSYVTMQRNSIASMPAVLWIRIIAKFSDKNIK